jgi:peptide-methionine (S)-S-oxide reductase
VRRLRLCGGPPSLGFASLRGRFAALLCLALAAANAWPAGADPKPEKTQVAIFAGGCFWCMEPPFDALDGVLSTTSGYTGGRVANPSYEQVSEGGTGHREAVRIEYDPAKLSYPELLEIFWRNVDPLDAGGQFCDRGSQYASAIFALDAEQRRQAEASKRALEQPGRLGKRVATEILEAGAFYPAEEYHQDYAQKNPLRYRYYRYGCGRDARLKALWGAAGAH